MNSDELMLLHILKCRRDELYAKGTALTPEQEKIFADMKASFERGVPLQYILGSCNFMGYELNVDPRVLIPRPETEILVQTIIETSGFKNGQPLRVLDLGTGSGNISIALAKTFYASHIVSIDVSVGALQVARENALMNNVENQIEFFCADMKVFLKTEKPNSFDIIVSNPPYIPQANITTLPVDVQQEPHLALDGGEDGLDFYRAILADGPRFLNKHGKIYFEVGDSQDQLIQDMALSVYGFKSVNFVKDYVGTNRVLIVN